jgi:large subunit ribosomal protein L47
MKSIKHTLTERWYTWDNARNEAMLDEEINMYADVDNGEIAYLRKDDDFEVSFMVPACVRSVLTMNRCRIHIGIH